MKNTRRELEARVGAHAYAPAPTDSRLLYGLVSSSLMLAGVFLVGGFYDIDPLTYPFGLLALTALAVGSGLLVRRMRLRRHRLAHRMEYNKAGGDA